MVDRFLSRIVGLLKQCCMEETGTWKPLYRDLGGGLQSLDNVIKSFTGTLVVSERRHATLGLSIAF